MCAEVFKQYKRRFEEYANRKEQLEKTASGKRQRENSQPSGDAGDGNKTKKSRKSSKRRRRERKRKRKRNPQSSESAEEGIIPVDFTNQDESDTNESGSLSPAYSPTSPLYSSTGSDTDSRADISSPNYSVSDSEYQRNTPRRHKRFRHRMSHTNPSSQESGQDGSDSDEDLPPAHFSDACGEDKTNVSCNNPTHLTKRTNTNISPAEVAAIKPKARRPIRIEEPIRRGAFYYELFTDVLDLPKGLWCPATTKRRPVGRSYTLNKNKFKCG